MGVATERLRENPLIKVSIKQIVKFDVELTVFGKV